MLLYVPAGQGITDVLDVEPGGQYAPVTLQAPEQDELGSPGVDPKRPTGHGLQYSAVPLLNVPGRHMAAVAFVEPTTQKYPAVHLPLHVDAFMPV